MVTSDFKDILRHASQECGLDQANLDTQDFRILRDGASDALQEAWDMEKWPELLRVEERTFRLNYDASTAYAAGAEVFYPVDDKYYQALRATTGNAPTSAAYWDESQTSYSASDYDNTKAYVAGDIVFYPTTDRFYTCHTASTGNVPTNTSFWGILTPFDRYVAYEQTGKTRLGEVFGVYRKNKRVFTNAERIPFELSNNGVQVKQSIARVWIEFRTRPPKLIGDAFDTAATYAADQQIYFSANGNFYDCLATTSAGESPNTAAAKWSVVQIPYLFQNAIIKGAVARWLQSDGQFEKAQAELTNATQKLGLAGDKLFRQQDQTRRLHVETR